MASRSSSSSSKTSRRCARPRERRFRALPYAITTLSQLGGPLQPPSPARSGGDLSSPRDCLQARSPSSRSPTSVPQPSRHTMETLEQSRRLGCHRGPTRARADRPGPPSCFGAQPRPRAARSAAPCRRRSGCPDGNKSHQLLVAAGAGASGGGTESMVAYGEVLLNAASASKRAVRVRAVPARNDPKRPGSRRRPSSTTRPSRNTSTSSRRSTCASRSRRTP